METIKIKNLEFTNIGNLMTHISKNLKKISKKSLTLLIFLHA